jgi:hypothetical protein
MATFKGFRGTLAQRFERKTIWEPNSGCLLWTGSVTNQGYGRILEGDKVVTATHVALRLAGKEVPNTMFVLHRCDNPSCVNVDHLFVGSLKANMADMVAKGRQNFSGLGPPGHNRISDDGRQQARDLFNKGSGITATARATNRSYSTIRQWFLEWGYLPSRKLVNGRFVLRAE